MPRENLVCVGVERGGRQGTGCMACILVCRGRMHAARACLPYDNVFGLMCAVPLFVGEATMPPGRGTRSRGVPGSLPVSLVL